MSRPGRILLVLVLCWSFAPGLGEVLEQAVHLVSHGHGAHEEARVAGPAGEGHDHEAPGTEHGCSGVIHLCGCHATVASLVQQADAVPGPADRDSGFVPRPSVGVDADHVRSIDHPPNA